jgi:hypothetical protein
LLDEALRLLRGGGNSTDESGGEPGVALLYCGDTALAQKKFDPAARRYQEALEVRQAGNFIKWPIDARIGLAAVNYCTGNVSEASALYMLGLQRAQELGIALLAASALLGLAGLAAESGSPERGARLFGAAEGIVAAAGWPIFPRDQPVRERALAALTAALGPERLAAAREAGRALTLEAAMAVAQSVTEAGHASP